MKNSTKFFWEGGQPPLPRRLRRLDCRVFGARPATPNVPVALTPIPLTIGARIAHVLLMFINLLVISVRAVVSTSAGPIVTESAGLVELLLYR